MPPKHPKASSNVLPDVLQLNEKNSINKTLETENSSSLTAAVVQVFKNQKNKWCKINAGVLCFVKDSSKKSIFFRLYNLNGVRLWEQEMYIPFNYEKLNERFHTFYADAFHAGINFSSENDANVFYQTVSAQTEKGYNKYVEKLSAWLTESNIPVNNETILEAMRVFKEMCFDEEKEEPAFNLSIPVPSYKPKPPEQLKQPEPSKLKLPPKKVPPPPIPPVNSAPKPIIKSFPPVPLTPTQKHSTNSDKKTPSPVSPNASSTPFNQQPNVLRMNSTPAPPPPPPPPLPTPQIATPVLSLPPRPSSALPPPPPIPFTQLPSNSTPLPPPIPNFNQNTQQVQMQKATNGKNYVNNPVTNPVSEPKAFLNSIKNQEFKLKPVDKSKSVPSEKPKQLNNELDFQSQLKNSLAQRRIHIAVYDEFDSDDSDFD